MIILTGGAGSTGSNIVNALNGRGVTDLLIAENSSLHEWSYRDQ